MASAYTPSQIERYLSHIDLPLPLREQSHPRDLTLLTALHIHQITTFPYENLSLHYNPAHANDVDPQALYAKFLPDIPDASSTPNDKTNGFPDSTPGKAKVLPSAGRGRGGYCMETCIFMREVLRGMGFRTFVSGAKIRMRDPDGVPSGPFVSWVHCVNVVTLPDGSRYSVDVGFGGDGPTRPVPLGAETPARNLGTQQVRVIRDVLPDGDRSALESHRWWIYQYRNGEDRPWNSYYAFPELEFSQKDLEHQNFWIARSGQSPQTGHVIMVKFLRGTEGGGEGEERPVVVGKRTLFDGVVKENMGGKTRVLVECKTEEERVTAIEEYFGVELTEELKKGIRGWVTELVRPEEVAVA